MAAAVNAQLAAKAAADAAAADALAAAKKLKLETEAERQRIQAALARYKDYILSGKRDALLEQQSIDLASQVYECTKTPALTGTCIANLAQNAYTNALTIASPVVGRIAGGQLGPLATSTVEACYKLGWNLEKCAEDAAKKGIILFASQVNEGITADYLKAVDSCIALNKDIEWDKCGGDLFYAGAMQASAPIFGVPPEAIVASRACVASGDADACMRAGVVAATAIACAAAGTAVTGGAGALVASPVCGFLAGPVGQYVYGKLGSIFNNFYRPDKIALEFATEIGQAAGGIITRLVHLFGGGEGCAVYERVWHEAIDAYYWPKVRQIVGDVADAIELLRAQMLLPPTGRTYDQWQEMIAFYAFKYGFSWRYLNDRPNYDADANNAMSDWTCTPDTALLNDRLDYMLKLQAEPAMVMFGKGAVDCYKTLSVLVAQEFRTGVENKAAALVAQSQDPAWIAHQFAVASQPAAKAVQAAMKAREKANVEAWKQKEIAIRNEFQTNLDARLAANAKVIADSKAQTQLRVDKAIAKQEHAKAFAAASCVAALGMVALAYYFQREGK